ncbi:hypothetical protein [Streptomyces yunnanensis]|uniref:Excreted virulence factor EspC, type VII ESX diderm n=1 Tax=Streptomyces yunnanensis TaxID=156453 RepID=A0A9X8MKW2_9ACTN|nr:hypothetical protein [Streptomyces yunnanensis]SHK96525.1 hypothetical protein SAMN05216268_10282 [Streptomyces yunnanensis]
MGTEANNNGMNSASSTNGMQGRDPAATASGQDGATTHYGAMEVDPEVLKRFKGRVDALLAQLKGSQAAPGALSRRTIPASAFGQGFAEAGSLADTYAKVLSQLEEFSRTFGEQIETLSIGTQFIGRSYEQVDADMKNRLATIQRRTQEFHKTPQPPATAQQPTGHPTDATGSPTTPDLGNGQTAAPDGI